MNIDEMVGQQVREHRKAAGLGQEGLADEVKEQTGVQMSRTTVVRIERGKRPVTIPELVAIALVLNVTPAELVTPVHNDDVLDVTANHVTTSARTYFWWVGLNPFTTLRGFVPDLATPTTMEKYEAALRRHVTQRFFIDAHAALTMLEQRRDEPLPSQRVPSEQDFEHARSQVRAAGRTFVAAIERAHASELPPTRVHADYWDALADSVNRSDPVGWAQDLGIEEYDPEPQWGAAQDHGEGDQ